MTETQADILFSAEPAAGQETLILEALAILGVSGRIRVMPMRRGLSELQWLVLVTLPMQAFLTSIGGKLGDDAYRGFQRVVGKLLRPGNPAAPASASRPVVLQDAVSGLRIVLEHDLPAEGYEQLFSLNLARFRYGPVHFDRATRRWRSETDEADPA